MGTCNVQRSIKGPLYDSDSSAEQQLTFSTTSSHYFSQPLNTKMFSRLAAFAIAAVPLLAAATPTSVGGAVCANAEVSATCTSVVLVSIHITRTEYSPPYFLTRRLAILRPLLLSEHRFSTCCTLNCLPPRPLPLDVAPSPSLSTATAHLSTPMLTSAARPMTPSM